VPRILLIEDDDVFRDHVAHALERAGFEVAVATDGEAGWTNLDAFVPHVVLLDLALPRLSGLSLLRRMRAHDRWRRVSVLVVSCHSDRAADAVGNGAQGYLIKGRFTMTQLIDTARRLLVAASLRDSDAE
jgi:two-component system phosphate regulon response regulator PhoB